MSAAAQSAPLGRRLLYFLPVLLFAVVAGYFLWGLDSGRDPRAVPSAMIDKPIPEFDLPTIRGMTGPGLAAADLRGHGVTLVNFFASWCIPCRAEHPMLEKLVRDGGVRLVGINYKNKPEEARAWLATLGNPYARLGADESGRVAIDWGVYGVPETFIVDNEGRIRYRQLGPLTPEAIKDTIKPMLRKLGS